MRYSFASAALLAGTSTASSFQNHARDAVADSLHLVRKSFPDAPDNYTPSDVDCPSTRPSVRTASELSTSESNFLDARREVVIPEMQKFLTSLSISGFDVESYFTENSGNSSALPNIGLAFSGGGYRAALNGAGAVQAFDSRDPNSDIASGGLGGLLQSSTYIAGLSGGSWLLGSMYINNFSSIAALTTSPNVWDFAQSIFEGPDSGGIQLLDSAGYFDTISRQVQGKDDAGFNTTITDYWGRALSFQLVNSTEGGPAVTWSSIRDQDGFSTGAMPYPIVIADGRAPGEKIISLNSSVYEFTPYEFGTWDPTTFGFVDLRYVGSNFNNGELATSEQCVRGFDNAGFVMGTSSSLFNQFLLNIDQASSLPSFITDALTNILTAIGDDEEDIAAFRPNPFFGFNPTGQSLNSESEQLTLVDGGSDLQNIPLQPLIQPVRDVDVIFAIDSSADVTSWPNGTAMVATYERSLGDIANGTAFPAIPDQNTFVNLGLNNKPTFFGCDATNTSSSTPLIVYIPNAPYVFMSNVTTFDPSYETEVRNAIIANGKQVATMGNNTVDSTWQTCVGCAILQRSLTRTGTTIPAACQTCYDTFCWNGTTDSSAPATPYAPELKLEEVLATAEDAAVSVGVGRVMMLCAAAAVWLMV